MEVRARLKVPSSTPRCSLSWQWRWVAQQLSVRNLPYEEDPMRGCESLDLNTIFEKMSRIQVFQDVHLLHYLKELFDNWRIYFWKDKCKVVEMIKFRSALIYSSKKLFLYISKAAFHIWDKPFFLTLVECFFGLRRKISFSVRENPLLFIFWHLCQKRISIQMSFTSVYICILLNLLLPCVCQ